MLQISAIDLAYLKGEASVQPGDTPMMALQRTEENNYLLAPDRQRDAFVAGFLSAVGSATETAISQPSAQMD